MIYNINNVTAYFILLYGKTIGEQLLNDGFMALSGSILQHPPNGRGKQPNAEECLIDKHDRRDKDNGAMNQILLNALKDGGN
ncbi:hypothetical protein GOP47_0018404 [Adiantum capillus-veneris]|uniref:Uncharacterized protein n=1 Tax=Adiantum capillus-veneris TaxID=13818 RepID=A0A9D4UDC3_ADICA|nr:hypothetical protein GOP47_0018404 [Adiantum capillus-veneris]